MTRVLHILNGDATDFVFKQTKIEGDVLVWREILSEGPVSLANLWEIRANWLAQTSGSNPNKLLAELTNAAHQFQQLAIYQEVILWFEYDLVCQINLIYILSQLNVHAHQQLRINLICPSTIVGKPNFRGLGELEPSTLIELMGQKQQINSNDIAFATHAWEVYVANDPKKIQVLLNEDFGNLHLLKNALIAHLQRWPSEETGLNKPEETLVQIVESGITAKKQIYQAFWQKLPVYGLGDLQIDQILQRLVNKGQIVFNN